MSTARSANHGGGDTLGADTLDQCQYLMEQRASELRDGGLQEAGIITARLLGLLDEVIESHCRQVTHYIYFYAICLLFIHLYLRQAILNQSSHEAESSSSTCSHSTLGAPCSRRYEMLRVSE